EPRGELGAVDRSHGDQRGQRHRLADGVAHVELTDVLGPGSVLALGLHVHLPDPSVLVEVVHEGAAQEGLQGLVDRRERDPLLEDFLDRKSTRLNSSHQIISYAVFCLKKKKKMTTQL